MADPIKPVGDQTQINTIKFNDNREIATQDLYKANTLLLSIFDTDNFKGFLSPKELEAFAIFSEDEYVEITDENGNKIRDVYKLDNNEYLVNDFNPDGSRYRGSIINVETGDEDHADFKLSEDGKGTTGLTNYKNGVIDEDIDAKYDENGNGTITTKKYEYDENGQLKKTKIHTREVQYDENGTLKGFKYTDTYKDVFEGQNLDIQS